MFTLHNTVLKRASSSCTILCAIMALCLGRATDLHAQPAPPNDDLTNALGIIGATGTLDGVNLYATAEPGEPAPYPGNPAQASVWYLWTAPYTTTMDFKTRGSTYISGPEAGQELDTVMAVYTLKSGTNLAFTNMTQIASNEDDPSGGVTSRLDFAATEGTLYLIQVDGSTNSPTGSNAQGNIVLSWSPTLVGGNFGFSTTGYFCGEFDDEILIDYGGNSIGPSLANKSGTNNIRITVVRKGGAVGKCEVTLSVTNANYTNVYETNYTGTNIYTTNYDLLGNVISWTNSFRTNIASQNLVEEYIDYTGTPRLVEVPSWALYLVTQTNYSGGFLFPPLTNSESLAGLGLTNFFTNFLCFNGTNVGAPVTNNNIVTLSVTQIFCTTVVSNVVNPAASNGVDYVALTTNIVFNDFQMSKDVYIQVNPENTYLAGADWPDADGNYTYYGINGYVTMSLSNPVLDPNDDKDILPPTLSTTASNSSLTILNFFGDPDNFIGSSTYLTTNGSVSGGNEFSIPLNNITVNLERATFRVDKSSATAVIYAVMDETPAPGSYTFFYTIDSAEIGDGTEGVNTGTAVPNNAFDWNGFPAVAGADYAQPDYWGVNVGADFGDPINLPADPSGYNVGRNTVWPTAVPYVGAFTFVVPGPPVAEIAIPILNNGAVEFDMDMLVQIFGGPLASGIPNVDIEVGNIPSAHLTINFSGTEPGGANDISFNPDGTATSYPPENLVPGANPPGQAGAVKAIAIQANGQSIIGGYFSSYNTTPIYGVARLLTNGYLDTSFNNVQLPGVNYGGFVDAIVIDSLGRIIIGGSFSSYDGAYAPNIARLNYDGSLDKTFTPGVGFNSTIYTLALDTNGNILVGGDFTSYNTTNCNHIARLTNNGALDLSFLPDTGNGRTNFGADADVNAVATDGNGNIILAGQFTHMNGASYKYVARLLPNGAVDTTFNPEIGPDAPINCLAVEQNNEIVIGGLFQNYNLVSTPGVAQLQINGALDTTFTPGTGADGPVYCLALQPDGDILVAGQFRNFNTSRRLSIARLLPQGWVDTSFMDTAYNQYAGLINKYYNDPVNTAYAIALQPDGNIMIGGSFTNVGGGSARDDLHTKINVARLIGLSNPGPQTGGGGIGNCPGNITLTQNPYTVDDDGSSLFVTLDRVNGSLGPATLTLGTNTLPPGPGSATAADFGLDLPATPLYNIVYNHWITRPYGLYDWRKSDGYYGYNNQIQPITDFGDSAVSLSIYDDKTALQNLFASISLLDINAQNIFTLGGVTIPLYPALGTPSATLEIVNQNFPPGLLGFSATNYIAVDTSNYVTLTVLRTNGDYGQVTVEYYTQNGTAISGSNYTGVSAGTTTTLTFPGGPTNSASFTIPIIHQSTVQNTTTFYVYLTNANYSPAFDTNLPPILPAATTVTIIDGNFAPGHLSFTSPNYSVLKGGVATIGVQRVGGAQGQLTVQVGTSNLTATAGLNYTGMVTNLFWDNQDATTKTFTVQTLQDNTVDGPLTLNLSLFNATNVGAANNDNLILTTPSNASLTILDSDSYGGLAFAAPNFSVLQTAGQALITVIRTNGTTGTLTVFYTTFNGTNVILPNQPAMAGTNYSATSGLLTFAPGQTSTNFYVPIISTESAETNSSEAANRIVGLELVSGTPSAISGEFPVYASLTILDTQLVLDPAGSVDLTTLNGTGFNGTVYSLALQPDGDTLAGGAFSFFNQYPFANLARLNTYGTFDSGFLFNMAGANGTVFQTLSQSPGSAVDGPVMLVGDFTQVNEVNRSGIARLNLNGSIDETFNPGSGADNTVFTLAQTFLPAPVAGQPETIAYYIGGNFANFDGIPNGGIARLNGSTNSPGYPGQLDPNFNAGQGVTGSNAIVHAVAVQANNQVILGGDFTSFNGGTYNHLIRLNVDGSIDTTFNPSTGPNLTDSVRAIAIQPDGRILVGGLFTNVNGVAYNHLVRLNFDGSLDTNFNLGVGGNNSVLALAIDAQQRILVGGEFTTFSGVTRSGLTRLNPDGTLDPTINFGSGADGGFVDSIVIETNEEIEVAGGFSTFEGLSENNFVRLYGGATAGNGDIQFSQAVYGVLESGTNAVITLQRLGGEGADSNSVSIVFSTSDGTAFAGTNYAAVTTNVVFPYGETFATVTIPITNNQQVGGNMTVNLNLSNPDLAGIGPQATAVLIITNVNAAVGFSAATYNEAADVQSGEAIVTLVRTGYPDSDIGATVYTGTNGTAIPYINYIPVTNFIEFPPGVITQSMIIPVLNPTNVNSDLTVDVEMTGASNAYLSTPDSATLYLDSVSTAAGVLAFSQLSYSVNEGATNAVITVIRTNGSTGAVAVTLTTSNGTATAGLNYMPINATLNFADGQSSQTTNIPIYQLTNATPNLTVYLTLSNPQGGAIIGGAPQEILTILNDIQYFSFANSPYFVGEGAGTVTLSIVRGGPTTTSATVNYATADLPNATEANGDAVAGVDYVPTSGTLTYAPGETFSTIPVTILQGNVVNPPLSFLVNLTTTATNVQTVAPNPATVTILSDVTGFEFSTNAYAVGENGSNIVITVNRLNPNTGAASVQFATSDGTNSSSAFNAVHGVDYTPENGVLTFLNGQASATFTVPILNQNIVESNKTFNVELSNPQVLTLPNPSTNAYLLSPSNAVVLITNVLSGVSFASANISVSECGVVAAIPVLLSGATNSLVSVNYSTSDGSGVAGTNYFATNGAITFLPGQTSTNIYVQVINNHIIGPNHTVLVTLSNPQGAQLLNPSTTVLTIDECNGAYVVQSGTAFVSGSATNNGGVIFSNETVTVLFGLRDVAGNNTSNLTATLLATNGVTNVSGPQDYGVLTVGGPTVARPFTFTAVGSNGQNIVATLTLIDGSEVYSNVAFGFTLGGQTTKFSTNETLLLYGSNTPPSKAYNTNAPNNGYPSQILVSGVVGDVTGVTVQMTNFGHSFPSDVEMVVESPSGQDTLLMSDCGGDTGVKHISLTFSENATGPLPENSALTSGTYLPTAYGFPADLPTTLPGQVVAPVPPFPTNMNALLGGPANGTWSLFVSDNDTLDSGYISNGWSLTISTGLPVESDADLETTLAVTPSTATLSNTLTYTVSVTNYGPAVATNVVIIDTLPAGSTYIGTPAATNGIVTFSAGTLAVSNGMTFTFSVMPNNVGYITNIAAATCIEPDPNSNNVQTNIQLVTPPSADLGVTLNGAPNPVINGGNVTYSVVVLNNGPSAATGVTAIDVLPTGFTPTSITTTQSQGTPANSNGTITWSVGTLANGASATMTLVAQVYFTNQSGLPASSLDSVTVSSPVYDPLKLNNYAAVKTEVEPSSLNISKLSSSHSLSWPVASSNLVLYGAFNVTGPWVAITNTPVSGGVYTYTLPGTNGFHFFSLGLKAP